MHNTIKGIISIFSLLAVCILASSFSSAYGYGWDGYKTEHYVKTTSDWNGNSYVERTTQSTPWGSHTSYVSDRNYNRGSPYQNQANDYWSYGWNGNVQTRYYVNYDYSDARRRTNYDSQYHPYYYQNYPSYDNGYYNWRSQSTRCNNVHACSW